MCQQNKKNNILSKQMEILGQTAKEKKAVQRKWARNITIGFTYFGSDMNCV